MFLITIMYSKFFGRVRISTAFFGHVKPLTNATEATMIFSVQFLTGKTIHFVVVLNLGDVQEQYFL